MNKKQLYESIMSAVAKQVKKVLNESNTNRHEFSKKDLKEIKDIILNDDDFYEIFCSCANFDYYDSYEEAVDDLMNFLTYDVYDTTIQPTHETHAWYILDEPDLGTSWARLKSGKIANMDNIWQEFKSIISQK